MQYAPNMVDANTTEHEMELCLNAFIVYEDVPTGKRAKETCDVLSGRLGPGWNIDIGMSSFKSLGHPQLRRHATAAVRDSGLVIFSCYGGRLPAGVCDWMESCLAGPDQPKSLVALIAAGTSEPEHSRAVEKHLFDLAQRHGMRFFCHFYAPVDETVENCFMRKEPNDDVF
jgi:hypothetical protein